MVSTMTSAGAVDEILGEWRAINRASGSAGSIHDDDTARKLGFRGGFVGGVTLVAYAVEGWRRREGLTLSLRPFTVTIDLRAPVYEGETARVTARKDGRRWAYSIETDSSGVTTSGAIDVSGTPSTGEPPVAPPQSDRLLDGVDLAHIERQDKLFTRAETAAFYSEVLQTPIPGGGELPVSIGMWSNPMTPIIERLKATHTTVHRGSEMFIERLPAADVPYTFLTTVEAITPRGPGKSLVHVRCEIVDALGSRLAVIQHRSAVRRRN